MEPAPFSSFLEWNYLPNEIKTTVIRKMDNSSRLALRACSSDSQKLVGVVPYRQIYRLSVHNGENEWRIRISRSVYSNDIKLEFSSFDEFQNWLTREIEINDYIKEMKISNEVVNNNLNLLKFGKLVRIGNLDLHGASSNSHVILEQVDSSYLKSFHLYSFDPITLHMPQITCNNLYIMSNNHIRDDQLLTFECSYIQLSECEMLTANGINNYIRKCLSNLDKNYASFRLWLSEENIIIFSEVIEGLDVASSEGENKVLINSPFPSLQLEVKYRNNTVIGRTIGNGTLQEDFTNSRTQNNFKVFKLIQISHSKSKAVLTLKKKDGGRIDYEFDSTDDMQLKLTEELDKADYIKNLDILSSLDGWKLTSLAKNKITVGKLSIARGVNRINYLRQIEPYHLKYIRIDPMDDIEEMYDMPQVIHAETLDFSNSCIRDDQLLKLNAVNLKITTNNEESRCNLTDSGINAYVKKCLLELNQHYLNFCFFESGNERNESIFFEGIDVFSQTQIDEFRKETIVNSPYQEYQLKLNTDWYSITGKRIKKA